MWKTGISAPNSAQMPRAAGPRFEAEPEQGGGGAGGAALKTPHKQPNKQKSKGKNVRQSWSRCPALSQPRGGIGCVVPGAAEGHGSLLLYPPSPSFTSLSPLSFLFSCLFLSFSTHFSPFLLFKNLLISPFLSLSFPPPFFFHFSFSLLVLVKRYLHFCWKSGP